MLFQGAFFPVYYLGTGIFNLNYLLSYPPVQDSVFLCQLPQQFREVECNESDLKLSYLDSNISSPLFSKLFYTKKRLFSLRFCKSVNTFLKLSFFNFPPGPMSLQFTPTAFVGGDGEVDFLKSFYMKKIKL
jgi:hypothetical protein